MAAHRLFLLVVNSLYLLKTFVTKEIFLYLLYMIFQSNKCFFQKKGKYIYKY